MTDVAMPGTPRSCRVVLAQLHLIAVNYRRPALLVVGLVVLVTLALVRDALGDNGRHIDFHPERSGLHGLFGLLFPIGVWLGEDRSGTGFFWTLPVDRRKHALLRVFAGWAWLMAAVALLVLWLLTIALVSGGTVMADETRLVLPSFAYGVTAFDPSAVQQMQVGATAILWLVPFTAATAVYLLTSALALGTRQPVRWLVTSALVVFAATLLADATQAAASVDRLLDAVLRGAYGIDALLSARTESLQVSAVLTTGESVVVWRALPSVSQWAAVTVLWLCAGAVLLWFAASRHREHRRG